MLSNMYAIYTYRDSYAATPIILVISLYFSASILCFLFFEKSCSNAFIFAPFCLSGPFSQPHSRSRVFSSDLYYVDGYG